MTTIQFEHSFMLYWKGDKFETENIIEVEEQRIAIPMKSGIDLDTLAESLHARELPTDEQGTHKLRLTYMLRGDAIEIRGIVRLCAEPVSHRIVIEGDQLRIVDRLDHT